MLFVLPYNLTGIAKSTSTLKVNFTFFFTCNFIFSRYICALLLELILYTFSLSCRVSYLEILEIFI